MDSMTIPPVHTFDHLLERARRKAAKPLPRTALVVPSATEWLQAFERAIEEKLVDPYIIGDEALAKRLAGEAGVELTGARFIDIKQPDQAIITAAQMTQAGELDLIVKGRGSTVEFLKLILSKEASFMKRGSLLSHIAAIKPQRYPKIIFLSDSVVTPHPDLKAKLSLVTNLIAFASKAGIESPRVALLTAVEAIYPQMEATTEAAVLAKMSERGQIKGGFVDGPLSFDVAIDLEAAHAKGITTSEVAGQVDCMVTSSIEVANGVYKGIALYGDADVGGILYGGRVPVALANRWDSVDSRFHSIVLGVLAV